MSDDMIETLSSCILPKLFLNYLVTFKLNLILLLHNETSLLLLISMQTNTGTF
ncbi:hypothetical protein Hanom_Chr15g01374271 [Helianthus anomalus]